MKVSKHFVIQEFVPKEIYDRFGDKSIWFIDPIIIRVAQFFRDRYNVSIIINDWHMGGKRTLSGFRPPSTKLGAGLSQHRFGRAIDLKWKGLDPETIRKDIKENQKEFLAVGLTTVEKGTDSWIHCDCRNTGMNEIYFVPYWKK